MQRKNVEVVRTETSELKDLVESKYDAQHARMIFQGRMRSSTNYAPVYEAWIKKFEGDPKVRGDGGLEGHMDTIIRGEVQKFPIHKWIIGQRGLSYDLAGQLIALIGEIKDFDSVSKLWAYAGLAVVDICQTCKKRYYPLNERGAKIVHISQRLMEQYEKKIVKDGRSDFAEKAQSMVCTCQTPVLKRTSQHKIEGVLLDYNPTLKMVCWKVGTQFIKQGDVYRKLYEEFRLQYEQREDLIIETTQKKGRKVKGKDGGTVETKGTAHIHRMAMRKMEKVFLSHLWLEWRKLEGLSVSMPYVIDIMKHCSYIGSPSAAVSCNGHDALRPHPDSSDDDALTSGEI